MVAACPPAVAQTTQCVILGRVYDEGTGRAIHPATVTTLHVGTGQRAYATVNANGRYTIGSFPRERIRSKPKRRATE